MLNRQLGVTSCGIGNGVRQLGLAVLFRGNIFPIHCCCRDYRTKSGLDEYEEEGLDQEFQDQMGYEERMAARRRAEAEMEARETGGGRGRKRMPGALQEGKQPKSCLRVPALPSSKLV